MSKLAARYLCAVLTIFCTPSRAETVLPLNGQTSQQTQIDMDDCRDVAISQSEPKAAPEQTEPDQPGRQHDEFYEGNDDTKPAYTACLQGKGYQLNP